MRDRGHEARVAREGRRDERARVPRERALRREAAADVPERHVRGALRGRDHELAVGREVHQRENLRTPICTG